MFKTLCVSASPRRALQRQHVLEYSITRSRNFKPGILNPVQRRSAERTPHTDSHWWGVDLRNFSCTSTCGLLTVPGSLRKDLLYILFYFRQPANDVEMALGGILPSISTFASHPTLKSKSIGSGNLVSSLWSLLMPNNITDMLENCVTCFLFTV